MDTFRYIEKHQPIDLGWKVKIIGKADVEKLQDWYRILESKYRDWKFVIGDNEHIWQTPIRDPEAKRGHWLPDDVGYYTLCWNDNSPGPKPFEQGNAKPKYRDNDNDQLNPRECFFGYALDLIKELPIRSKKWLVTDHTPGTKLITHQDSPDKIRIHIPIFTNDSSNWIIDGEEYHMDLGNIYIVNTTLPHSVENNGNTSRVHLYGKVWTDDVIKEGI